MGHVEALIDVGSVRRVGCAESGRLARQWNGGGGGGSAAGVEDTGQAGPGGGYNYRELTLADTTQTSEEQIVVLHWSISPRSTEMRRNRHTCWSRNLQPALLQTSWQD